MKEFSEMKATTAAEKAKATSDLKKTLTDDFNILQKYIESKDSTSKDTSSDENFKSTLDRFLKNIETFNTPDSNSNKLFISTILPKLSLSDKDLTNYATQAAKYGNWALASALTKKISEADKDLMPDLSDLLHDATKSKQMDIVEKLLSIDVKFSSALTSEMQTTLEQAAKQSTNKKIINYTEKQMGIDNLIYAADNLDNFKGKLTSSSNESIQGAYKVAVDTKNYQVLEAFHAAAQDISYFTKIKSALPQQNIELMMSESKIQQELKKAIANKQWNTVEALQKQGYAIALPLDEKTATALREFSDKEGLYPITAQFYEVNENKIRNKNFKTVDELKEIMISELDQKKPDSIKLEKVLNALTQPSPSETSAPTLNMHETLKGKLTNNIIDYLISKNSNLPPALSTYVISDDFQKECFSNPKTLEHALSIRDKKEWLLGPELDKILEQALENKNTELLEKILKLSDKPDISSVLKTNIAKILSNLPSNDSKKTKEMYDLVLSDEFKKNTGLTDLDIATQVLQSNNQELIANFVSHVGTEKLNSILLSNNTDEKHEKLKELEKKIKEQLFQAGIKWDNRLESKTPNLFQWSIKEPDNFLKAVKSGKINVNAKNHQGISLIEHVLKNIVKKEDESLKDKILIAMINKGADLYVFNNKTLQLGQLTERTNITPLALTTLSNTPALKEKLFSTDPKQRQAAAEEFISLGEKSNLLKADINHKVTLNGDTMLHIAAYQNDTNLTDYLLENGANLNIKNIHGETPLFWAAKHGNISEKMAAAVTKDIANVENTSGLTALDIALETGNEKNIRLLIDKGANKFSEDSKKYLDKIESPALKAMLASCEDGKITEEKKNAYLHPNKLEANNESISPLSPLTEVKEFKNYFAEVTGRNPTTDTSNEVINLMDHSDYKQEAHQSDLENYLTKLSNKQDIRDFNDAFILAAKEETKQNVVRAAIASNTVAKLDMPYIPKTQRKTVLNSLESSLTGASEESKKTIREKSASLIERMNDADIAESINMIMESDLIPLTRLQEKLTDNVIKAMSAENRKEFVEKYLENDINTDTIKKILSNAPLHELADLYKTVNSLETNDNEQNKATKLALKESILERKAEFYQVSGLASTMHKLAETLDDKVLKDAIEETRPDLKKKDLETATEEVSPELNEKNAQQTAKKDESAKQEKPQGFSVFKVAFKAVLTVLCAIGTAVTAVFAPPVSPFLGAATAYFGKDTYDTYSQEKKNMETKETIVELKEQVSALTQAVKANQPNERSENLNADLSITTSRNVSPTPSEPGSPQSGSSDHIPSNNTSMSSLRVDEIESPLSTPKNSKKGERTI